MNVVLCCDDLARTAIELRRDLIDDDEGLGWVLRLQDRMAAVRIEAATLLDDHPEPPRWDDPGLRVRWPFGTPANGGR